MGMFDSVTTYQVAILGGSSHPDGRWIESHATVRDGVLASVYDARDESLWRLDYSGGWQPVVAPKEA